MIEHSVKLVVIDSIAVLARADAAATLQERQALLGQLPALCLLKVCANSTLKNDLCE